MAQFLYRMKPVRAAMLAEGPTEEEIIIIGEHFVFLERLVANGVVLMVGRTLVTDERSFGLVLFSRPTEEEARALMESDPAIKKGVMEAELFPFTVALWSSKGAGQIENAG